MKFILFLVYFIPSVLFLDVALAEPGAPTPPPIGYPIQSPEAIQLENCNNLERELSRVVGEAGRICNAAGFSGANRSRISECLSVSEENDEDGTDGAAEAAVNQALSAMGIGSSSQTPANRCNNMTYDQYQSQRNALEDDIGKRENDLDTAQNDLGERKEELDETLAGITSEMTEKQRSCDEQLREIDESAAEQMRQFREQMSQIDQRLEETAQAIDRLLTEIEIALERRKLAVDNADLNKIRMGCQIQVSEGLTSQSSSEQTQSGPGKAITNAFQSREFKNLGSLGSAKGGRNGMKREMVRSCIRNQWSAARTALIQADGQIRNLESQKTSAEGQIVRLRQSREELDRMLKAHPGLTAQQKQQLSQFCQQQAQQSIQQMQTAARRLAEYEQRARQTIARHTSALQSLNGELTSLGNVPQGRTETIGACSAAIENIQANNHICSGGTSQSRCENVPQTTCERAEEFISSLTEDGEGDSRSRRPARGRDD